ncbi:MAG: hypothetical protein JO288_12000 [Hyphomicrobiales bacterium]|nr:hypothetical protein [Hyphomicrobiales bacterium]
MSGSFEPALTLGPDGALGAASICVGMADVEVLVVDPEGGADGKYFPPWSPTTH